MPRKKRKDQTSTEAQWAPVPADVLDQFVRDGPLTAAEVESASQRFKKALIERALGAELSHHLGYPAGAPKPEATSNHRNGTSEKRVLTDDGPLPIAVPRDRHGTFEPQLIGKHERRFTGFDDKIIALYARGLTVREIQGFLAEMYAVDVSPNLISSVTDAVVAEVTAWQARPLERLYPVIFFDALRVKIRDEAVVRSKAVYLALGILTDGSREILGLWIEQTEGAKFWMKVFNDLKTRGCDDIPGRRDGRVIGNAGGFGGGVSRDDAANLRRPLDSAQPGVRQLERPQAACGGAPANLHGPVRGDRPGAPRRPGREPIGAEVSRRRRRVAPRVAAGHAVLCLPAGGAAGDLHHQRARERQRPAPEDH